MADIQLLYDNNIGQRCDCSVKEHIEYQKLGVDHPARHCAADNIRAGNLRRQNPLSPGNTHGSMGPLEGSRETLRQMANKEAIHASRLMIP